MFNHDHGVVGSDKRIGLVAVPGSQVQCPDAVVAPMPVSDRTS